jgi:hypothetical protein
MQLKTRGPSWHQHRHRRGCPEDRGIASPAFAAGQRPNCPATNTPVAGNGGTPASGQQAVLRDAE